MGMFSSPSVVLGLKALAGSDCNPVESKSSLYCKVSRSRVWGTRLDAQRGPFYTLYENKVQLLCELSVFKNGIGKPSPQQPGTRGVQYI